MTVDPAVSQQDVGSPATGHEPDWRGIGHLASAAAIEVAEHVDGGEQLCAVRVGAQTQRRQDARGELARGVVALAELLDVVVLQRPLDLGGEVKCELELLRGCALPDGLADLRIGDLGVQQDLEQLAEHTTEAFALSATSSLSVTSARRALACWMPTPSSNRSTISSVTRAAASAQNASSAGWRNPASRRPIAWLVAWRTYCASIRRRFAGIISRSQSSACSARSSSSFSIDSPIRPTDRVS